jgi:hypothetical protein
MVKNGVATALTCQRTGLGRLRIEDIVHSVSVAQDDRIEFYMSIVTAGTASTRNCTLKLTAEFHPT